MKIGILGGTFNPVHYGHLRSAEEVRESLSLDRIIFMPCYLPPHKDGEEVAPPDARLAMLELAIKDNPKFSTSDLELKRGGKSYSIETMKELENIYGESGQLSFIIGMDSFVEIGIWKSYSELFATTNFIVVARPEYMGKKSPPDLLPVDIRGDFCYDSKSRMMEHSSGRTTCFIKTTLLEISSTKIRKNVAEERSIRYLLPLEVERYVEEKGLYRGKR